jgi:hypothetical protein
VRRGRLDKRLRRRLFGASLFLVALTQGADCCAQAPSAVPKPAAPGGASADPPAVEEVIVSAAGLYGDWKMVLPEWPGFDKPVTGDFCTFKKHDEGVAIVCADDFLQEIPEVTFDGDKLRLRWGGAFRHTIYDAVWQGNGSIDGEIVQASMGVLVRRIRAKMERVTDQPAGVAPQESVAVINNYFTDLAAGSVRENYYEEDVFRRMKQTPADRAALGTGLTVKYFGRILEDKGHGPTFPDVFKVSNAANAAQWCLVRRDAQGLADVRCTAIP